MLGSAAKNPLYRNAIYLIANNVLASGLGFFFWMIAARYYPVKEVGIASAVISAMVLLAMLGSLGFPVALVRFLPEDRDKNPRINTCFALSTTATILLAGIFLLGLPLWSEKLFFILRSPFFIFLFLLFTTVWTLSLLSDSVFIAHRRANLVLLKNAVFSVLKLPLPVLLVSLGGFGIYSAWGIASLVSLMFAFFLLFPKIMEYRLGFKWDKELVRSMFSFSSANYAAGLFREAPRLVLPLLITNVLNPAYTAYFYVSWMIAGLLFIIPVATSHSLLAEASSNQGKLGEFKSRSVKFITVLLIPAIALLLLLAEKLLLLFGKEYSENAVMLLQVLAVSSLPYAVNILYAAVKNVHKEIGKVVTVNGLIALLTLALSHPLMLNLGLIGVGIAWLVANSAVAGLVFWDISRRRVPSNSGPT